MGTVKGSHSMRTMRLIVGISVLFITFMCIACGTYVDDSEGLSWSMTMEAIEGQTAFLPCNITATSADDMVHLVMWFVSTSAQPLYTFDGRGRPLDSVSAHCSASPSFQDRSSFDFKQKPSVLVINNLQTVDEGIYRCRVDFKESPTRNYEIKLKVLVPPKVIMLDEFGNDLAGKIGPLKVGDNVTVVCEIWGGYPKPWNHWVLDDKTVYIYPPMMDRTDLIRTIKWNLTNAQRGWLHRKLVCQATSKDYTKMAQRMAVIEMDLKPTSVKIVNKTEVKMVAEKETHVICEVTESWPAAQIHWYINDELYLRGEEEEFIRNNTTTIGHIYMIPDPSENGKVMKCQAVHQRLGNVGDDFFIMDVKHKPVVTLRIGNKVNEDTIIEGEDVYFECLILSNPSYNRVTWFFNGEPVSFKNITRVFTTGMSLVLRGITRKDIGLYTCKSANQLGETSSNPVYLRVFYAPECAHRSPITIGARIDEVLRVRCVVKADPDNVTFDWTFNNTKDKFEVSPVRFDNSYLIGSTTSELHYRAASDRDYGTLQCSSTNIMGVQKAPCLFNIVPPSQHSIQPTAPRNCTAMNTTWGGEEYLTIRCIANIDDGFQQHFTLGTIYDRNVIFNNTDAQFRVNIYSRQVLRNEYSLQNYGDNVIMLNVSWSLLKSLSADDILAVYSHNSRGQSDPTPLPGLVIGTKRPTTALEPVEATVGFAAETTVAVLIVLAVLIAAVVAVLTYKSRRNQPSAIPKRSTGSVALQTSVHVDAQGRRHTSVTYPREDPAAAGILASLVVPDPDETPPAAPRVILNQEQPSTTTDSSFRMTIYEEYASSSNNPPPYQVTTVAHIEYDRPTRRRNEICTTRRPVYHTEPEVKETVV